tara:strand:+ start:340 stop:510 length:171 start_codon:yes stop_codon:yes gene_type:complete
MLIIKKNGTYLEIGVYDGEKNSNTYILDKDYNWKGVCVDPFMKNMEIEPDNSLMLL